ncbi:hypothetical protein [Legionella santicrucis]|nr:hypothetical protein [Legionella santicrucis]
MSSDAIEFWHQYKLEHLSRDELIRNTQLMVLASLPEPYLLLPLADYKL